MYTDSRSRYSDSLQAVLLRVRKPVVKRFLQPVQIGSEDHPASCIWVQGLFPGGNRLARGVDNPLRYSANTDGIPVYPLCAYLVC